MPFHYPGYMQVDREENAATLGSGLEHRAGRAEPHARADHDRDSLACPPGRRALALHHGREPDDDRAEPQRHAPAHGTARIPGGAGHLHQRVGRLRRCLSAGGVVGGEGRHLYQHRPPRPARAPGASRRAARRAPTRRSSATWRSASSSGWGVRPAPAGTTTARRPSTARWRAWPPCSRASPTPASTRSACNTRCPTKIIPARPSSSPTASHRAAAASSRWSTSPWPRKPTTNTRSS